MKLVIQRVSEASVKIDDHIKGQIAQGLMILVGIEEADTNEDADWLTQKVTAMRIFGDAEGKMNLSVKDIDGNILLISQFTLHASTKKGNRPSFIKAARPEQAIPLYNYCIQQFSSELGKPIETGEFGADMKVALINDGPVTIVMDSKSRE
jgi:D-aminoacyl-tRNA deacylase